jgi:hypothetical protein
VIAAAADVATSVAAAPAVACSSPAPTCSSPAPTVSFSFTSFLSPGLAKMRFWTQFLFLTSFLRSFFFPKKTVQEKHQGSTSYEAS